MIPKLTFTAANWAPEHREEAELVLGRYFILNKNEDIWVYPRNFNCHIESYIGCENCRAYLLDYGYADTEAAIEKYLQRYIDDLDNKYFVEVGLMEKDYEKYYKDGPYINSDGIDTGQDFYDIYTNTEDEPETEYENSWVTVTIYIIKEKNS